MATHSSSLVWEIPLTEEPGGIQSLGSQKVGHDQATKHMGFSVKNQKLPGKAGLVGPPTRLPRAKGTPLIV